MDQNLVVLHPTLLQLQQRMKHRGQTKSGRILNEDEFF